MTASGQDERATLRRWLGWTVVVALCVAALTGIVAVLTGSFDESDLRVIALSFGFAIFSATGASGMSLRFRASSNLQTLGLVTVVVSALSFVLLVVALWNEESETAWEAFGYAVLTTFAASHAALVAGARRDTDNDAIRAVVTASIAISVLDSGIGILAIAGAFDDVDEGFVRFVAVLVILLLLTTVLPPILRRLQRAGSAAIRTGSASAAAAGRIADRPRRTAEPRRRGARPGRSDRGAQRGPRQPRTRDPARVRAAARAGPVVLALRRPVMRSASSCGGNLSGSP